MNSLELRDLHKTYKRKIVALDGLNLEVPSGCIFGLLGPNGAGKSTAINIVAGIVRRNSGDVYILGEPVGDHEYKYKRYVGFVLEKPHSIEKLTVKESLRLMTDRGVTIVISSHVLDTIEKLCDEIAIINNGKRVLRSTTDTLRTRIKNDIIGDTYTRATFGLA